MQAHRLIHAARAALALAACAAAGGALAQAAGSYQLRVGVTTIQPEVRSGDLTPPAFVGTKADIDANTQPTAGITYMWTGHLALDLPLSAGFKHDIQGDGAIAGVGKIGEVRALPATLLLQYRFRDPAAQWRPYVGAGPTYAKFYKARSTLALTALTGGTPANPTTLAVESKWAATVQAGLVVNLDARWFVDATVLKTFLKTRTTLSTGQTLDAQLDPWSAALSVGYRF